jgi:hypothetical protein
MIIIELHAQYYIIEFNDLAITTMILDEHIILEEFNF